ncbi:MAG: hypothetical protein E7426_01020 [Ruminococcaceae bacterium]|nr:hypothetical protein [Oscillospiraceae bacterium]
MSRPAIPWDRLRRDYESGVPEALLCARHGVSRSSLSRHRRAEGWAAPSDPLAARLDRVAARLERASSALLAAAESGGEVNLREIKDMAALLKELSALRRTAAEDAPARVRVVLAAELADWAE